MEQIKAPDGYEIVGREKEPDAIVGNDWLVAAIDKGHWTDSAYIGDPMRETDRGCIYARPIRKRTLWVPASERQPPVGRTVLVRHDQIQTMPVGSWRRYQENEPLPARYLWLDLDAAEAIEAERDRLAAQCAEHAARIAELERELADAKLNRAADAVRGRCVDCRFCNIVNVRVGGVGACHRFPDPRGIHSPATHWCGEFDPSEATLT